MKWIIITAIAVLPATSNAQFGNLLKKAKDKAENKINQRVDNKIDKGIDKSLDKAEAAAKPGNTNDVQTPASTGSEKNELPETSVLKNNNPVNRLSKFDFIAGEQIVYVDDFENEAIAELPTGWNTSGSGEVVTINNMPGKWLSMHQPFIYLTSNEKEFRDNYTVEFDLVMQLKSNGWMYPEFSVGIFSTNGTSTTGNEFLKGDEKFASVVTTIHPAEYKSSKLSLKSYLNNKSYFNSDTKTIGDIEAFYGKPLHVSIQVQKERYRIWLNDGKALDIPKAVPQGYMMNQVLFHVGSTNYKDDQYGMYVSNIKVAKGLPDTRHKLIEEGKFSTTAILFDVNTATIKPESGGVIKEIGHLLTQYKDVKIKIAGHTDNDGADAANITLSQKRADAVKDALVNEYKIDASRIETEGKGEGTPVADNKTKEGKAANRRVEFIKI